MKILKRDGSETSFNPNKIHNRIKKASSGLKVSPDQLFVKVITALPMDDFSITTATLDNEIARIAAQFITTHPDYSRLAARIALNSYYKTSNASFYQTMLDLCNQGIVSEKLVEKIESYGTDKVDAAIVDDNDEIFDYFGFETLKQMYLLKNPVGVVVERPQHMYMRIAIWLTDTFEDALVSYNALSKQLISCATPIMINAGTKVSQLISCTLIENKEDSREGILETLNDVSNYSSNAAGIGLCLSNVRSAKSKIAASGGNAGGLLKYVKMVNENLRFFNQQGRRPGAAAIYVEPWHKDIYDLIHIKNPNGKDELRARDTFLALWCPDLFFKCVEKGLSGEDDTWYLFCPNDVKKAGLKPLHKVYGDEFEEVYNKCVELGIGEPVSALDIWKNIYTAHMETGTPYILSKDNANKKSNHKNIGPLIMSNLCAEIFEVATPYETAQCTLGSMVLKNFIKGNKKSFDFDLLIDSVGIMVKMLNKAIDINDYSTSKGELCGKKQRALAIGVQGLADVFFIKDMVYDSEEARKLNKDIFEAIYYGAIKKSNELVKSNQYTKYSAFEGSPMSEGLFQFDLWGEQPTLKGWDELKKDVMEHGVCNSLFTAAMPVASSAKITGSNEMYEPQFNNIYNRKVIGGEYLIINTYLINDLLNLGLWDDDIKNELMIADGDLSAIDFSKYITMTDELNAKLEHYFSKYRTTWQIPQRSIIDMAADRGIFIDQSQSMNLHMSKTDISSLSSALLYGWKKGLKTLCYYVRTKAVDSAPKHLGIQVSKTKDKIQVDKPLMETPLKEKPENSDFDCFGCSA